MIIVFEGPDGVGKSTVVDTLVKHFNGASIFQKVYQPESFENLSKIQKDAAYFGMLFCDREKAITSEVYRKALPERDWSAFDSVKNPELLKCEGVQVWRFLLINDKTDSSLTEYSQEEYERIREGYLNAVGRFNLIPTPVEKVLHDKVFLESLYDLWFMEKTVERGWCL